MKRPSGRAEYTQRFINLVYKVAGIHAILSDKLYLKEDIETVASVVCGSQQQQPWGSLGRTRTHRLSLYLQTNALRWARCVIFL